MRPRIEPYWILSGRVAAIGFSALGPFPADGWNKHAFFFSHREQNFFGGFLKMNVFALFALPAALVPVVGATG